MRTIPECSSSPSIYGVLSNQYDIVVFGQPRLKARDDGTIAVVNDRGRTSDRCIQERQATLRHR